MFAKIPDRDDALSLVPVTLVSGLLCKALSQENEDAPLRFAGIASDEDMDVEGDVILRKVIDLSYAQQRGYVNWDHSREPIDQLGFLTKAVIISPKEAEELSISLGVPLKKSASVYVEGELYRHNDKAKEVFKLLKSIPDGAIGLGLSLDGAVARDKLSKSIVKAYVRGVAITAIPAHANTLIKLRKSLQAYNELEAEGQLTPNLAQEIAMHVVDLMNNAKADQTMGTRSLDPGPREDPLLKALDLDQATLFILKHRPHWTYDLASKVVRYTIEHREQGA